MAGCDDTRQLTEAQRQEAFQQQQRAGVMQAVRPFTGAPTAANLADYINRELFPAVKQTRGKLNEVFRQVTDNAPSGNPLQFYFSAETANADPTTGRVRLDNATEDSATTIRVSQTNGRLVDVAPWLDVMAGGATSPLGVVTLSDAINPARFIRFDLTSMTDQGAYWDLGVTPVESSSDNPFVDGGGVAISFIPGVSSAGSTVPAGSLSPIGAETVLCNPTSSVAAPTDLLIPQQSVLGRSTIDNPDLAAITSAAGRRYLGSNSVNTTLTFRALSQVDMPTIQNNRFLGNITGAVTTPTSTDFFSLASDGAGGIGWNATTSHFELFNIADNFIIGNVSGITATPIPVSLASFNSTTLTYDNTLKNFFRPALTGGDVQASANSNVLTVVSNAVTNAKLDDMAANTVKGNNTGSTADPTDIAVGTNSVLGRVAGNIVAAQVVTGQITDANVTDAKISNRTALSVFGRSANSSGVGADMAAANDGEVLRRSGTAIGFGTIATAGLADGSVTNAKLANMAEATVKGRAVGAGTGAPQDLTGAQVGQIIRFGTVAVVTAGTYAPYTLGTTTDTIIVTGTSTFHGFTDIAEGREIVINNGGAFASGITVSFVQFSSSVSTNTEKMLLATTQGTDAVSVILPPGGSLKLRGGSSGSGSRWRQQSGFELTTVQAANTVLANATASATVPTAVSVGTNTVVGRVGSNIVAAQLVTAQITDANVTDAKISNRTALSVFGRTANSGGVGADIAATAASGAVLRESGSALGFGTIATAGLADASVTLAKMANLAAGTIIGRQIDAGTGVPIALIGSEIAEIIRWSNAVTEASGGTLTDYALDTLVDHLQVSATTTITGIAGGTAGRQIIIENSAAAGSGVTVTLVQFATSVAGNRFLLPNSVNLVLSTGNAAVLRYIGSRWRCVGVAGIPLTDGDKGDITVSASGATWTIDSATITNAKLRDSGALSVIGRSANSSGAPADVSAVAASDSVLRESGSTIGFGTIATAGLANNAVTDAKLRQGAALTVIGRSANSTGNVADIATSADGDVLRRSGTTLGFGAIATAGITDAAVTLAKMANLAQSRIIGRAEGAGTGVPTALTPTDVVAIIDGENATWTGAHSFTGATHTVNSSGLVSIASSASTVAVTAGAGLVLAATTTIDANSPTRLQNTIGLTSRVANSTNGQIDDLAAVAGSILRFTAADLLTGIQPISSGGQFLLIVNANATDDLVIAHQHTSSAAANRFAGLGTSRTLHAEEMALAWYDGDSSRWRLLIDTIGAL